MVDIPLTKAWRDKKQQQEAEMNPEEIYKNAYE